MGHLRETFRMRKTSIAENWSAVEELRMVISRVGEERRTLEAQLGKVNRQHFRLSICFLFWLSLTNTET